MLLNILKNKRLVFYLAFFFNSIFLLAQKDYFQQRVQYDMDVRLNDKAHSLSANQRIRYVNNSPHTLEYIYFHLWPNAYRDHSTALAKQLLWQGKTTFFYSKPDQRGYIDSLDFKVNGNKIVWTYDSLYHDICKLILPTPLLPGDSILISTPFYVKIPEAKFSRMGHSDQAYYITQWYPKPAVFDNMGWHQMPYLDQGEFFSEFGSFDVRITLPSNYVLCATGDRQDAAEEELFLEKRANETAKQIQHHTQFDFGKGFPKSDTIYKTIRFKQDRVHDFAWFADKRFFVAHEKAEMPGSSRTVDAWVFYLEKNRDLWKDAVTYVSMSTQFYSRFLGEYPYEHVTAIDGNIIAGGGMEYPNITVIGEAGTAQELDLVITHEVGHNWFYGMLASNERDFPFLDEGINSFYETRYIRAKYPKKKLSTFIGRDTTFKFFGINEIPFWKYHEIAFYPSLRAHTDQEISLRSTAYTESNYGSCVYSKSALVFDALMDYIGEDVFDNAMRVYFNTYKFKHPNSNDLFKTLSDYSGKDLNGFKKHLVLSNDKVDLCIQSLTKKEDGTYQLRLKNKTGTKLPFNVYGYKQNKLVSVTWLDAFEKERTALIKGGEIDRFKIDGLDKLPDINRRNNSFHTDGIFKHRKPLNLNLFTRFEDPTKTTINYLPIAGGNFYNGAMLGMAFHNWGFYQKRFEYLIAPMYAFQTKDVTGFADFNYNMYPKEHIQQITIGAKFKSYSYDYFNTQLLNGSLGTNYKNMYLKYYKIAPYIQIELKKKEPTQLSTQYFTYTNTNLFTDSINYSDYPSFAVSGPHKKNVYSFVNQLSYDLINKRIIDPYSLHLELQHTVSMAKVSATLNYKWRISQKAQMEFRIFAGTFLAGDLNERSYYAFRASGYNGWHDYLFDANFAARNERSGFGFTQFTEKDGALNVWTPLGQSPYWLGSINVKSPRLFGLPFKVFADGLICDGRALNEEQFLWDAGLNIILWQNIVEIFVPLVYSKDIKTTHELNGVDFVHSIRFTFNIHKLAPRSFIQNSLF